MNILSSAALPIENRKKLNKTFPEINFIFCESIEEAKDHLSTAEIIITYGDDLSENILNQTSNLKWVMVIAAGIDKLPFEALHKRDILVTSAKGIHKAPMSEYVFFMMMSVYRQGKRLIENEKNKVWTRDIQMEEITGKSLLIAGTGVIGQEIAKVAKAFQMKTIGVSRSGKTVNHFDKNITHKEMKTHLNEVDFVVSVLPSTSGTQGFFKYEHFEAMPNHAVFINIGRGDAVRAEDVLKAVQEKEIYHAVLDVFETEPLSSDHPFWEEENITVTTHLSGVSPHYFNRALEIFSENLKSFQEDGRELVNIVDTQKGY
ncbi:D-2-hydroxyacid dehydrogenase [Salipaludibacillus neizhouensis]|uniref:D-2-hydroxyacid dehydrogenase n=1 Tax=Salipaludibacillus neizhouensis TaxID=885475 RepID=A0A3A9K564_9BACI|nr:D-2-hydroxyacid dehydrogenase [Salipaludibacillus neizhouensis]RKL66498.1 D-2-hydroxyacid dehydrogenase [Salipaludibacillus neizhouensis]